jgi:hypothetical protein
MGGGKGGSAPAAPDYTPIAQSDDEAAQLDYQASQNQLAFAQQQWNQQWPYTQNVMNAMSNQMNAETTQAQQQQQFYQQVYQPMEVELAQQAQQYASPAMQQQQAAAAEADVSSAYGAQRQAALQQLESYGIDPSQTRYGAMDLGARISQAASSAAAGTQATLNTQATGLSLLGEEVNIGRGYPGSIAQSYATAQGAGSTGVNAGLNTANTYSNMMGTPTQWGALSAANYGNASSAMNTQFGNELSSYNAETAAAGNTAGGIGSLIGGVGAAAGIAAIAI